MSDQSSSATSVYLAYQGNTYLFGGNAPYVEEMYENYLANPGSVPDTVSYTHLDVYKRQTKDSTPTKIAASCNADPQSPPK